MKFLIINPYASPAYLSEQLKKNGINTIAIYTQNKESIVDYFKPCSSWFDQQIFLPSADVDEVLKYIGDTKIDYVINGYESALELSDQLAQILIPNLANDPQTFRQRNDKFVMHKKLAEHNIRHIHQQVFNLSADNFFEISQKIKFPCFIKPLLGSASLYAKKIDSIYEFSVYFSKFDRTEFLATLMLPNIKSSFDFLICEYVSGEEYIIDTFSKCGVHYLSSVQQNVKKLISGVPFYRYTEIIINSHIVNTLNKYVNTCLDALGFNNGFAHSEVLLNGYGPCLVEVNPRISGNKGTLNQIATLSGMDSQIDLLAKYICNLVPRHPAQEFLYYRIVYIFNFALRPVPDLAQALIKFKTVKEIKYSKAVGSVCEKPPNSLMDVVALIICASNELAELISETENILYLDENKLI